MFILEQANHTQYRRVLKSTGRLWTRELSRGGGKVIWSRRKVRKEGIEDVPRLENFLLIPWACMRCENWTMLLPPNAGLPLTPGVDKSVAGVALPSSVKLR